MWRIALWAVAIASVAGPIQSRAADSPKTPAGSKQPYLGVDLQPMPHALFSQLPGILPKGQGVLIGFVEKGSPADKAGLKMDDVVLSFDKKDVVSPDQLV